MEVSVCSRIKELETCFEGTQTFCRHERDEGGTEASSTCSLATGSLRIMVLVELKDINYVTNLKPE